MPNLDTNLVLADIQALVLYHQLIQIELRIFLIILLFSLELEGASIQQIIYQYMSTILREIQFEPQSLQAITSSCLPTLISFIYYS